MTRRPTYSLPLRPANTDEPFGSPSSHSSYAPPVTSTLFGILPCNTETSANRDREDPDSGDIDQDGDYRHDLVQLSRKLIYTVIYAATLIPGDGAPIHNAVLVSEGKLIVWIGPQSDLPGHYVNHARKRYEVPYLMPGLWDCHVHCFSASEEQARWPAYYPFFATHPANVGARLTRGLWETIQWGYTSIRDLAGVGTEIISAIEDGTIVGPNIYSAGGALSQLAGHGDVFSLPAGEMLAHFGVNEPRPGHYGTNTICMVDGIDECRRGVRMQIRRGAKCIKVLASGGIMSSDDNPRYAQFSPEELKVIVEEASRMDRAVAAHVHGKPGILAAVNAGVTTVEHVSFADQECIDLIKEKGVIYVATLAVDDLVLAGKGKGIPKRQWDKIKEVTAAAGKAYKLAIKNSVTVALGTDTSPGFPMAKEIELAVKAGMSNLEALKAATANGPLTVKGQVPKTGQLKVGYEADFIGVLENPVEDVKVLQKRENIKWVWKGGKLYKGPGVDPWGEV